MPDIWSLTTRYGAGLAATLPVIPATLAAVVATASISGDVAGTAGLTLTHGFALADGDVVYLVAGRGDANATTAAAAGFTRLDELAQAPGNDRYLGILRRVVTTASSEPATWTVTTSDAGISTMVVLAVQVRSANTTTPEDATTTEGYGLDDFTPANPAITTITAGSLVLLFNLAAAAMGTDYASRTAGAPSGYGSLASRKASSATYRHLMLSTASRTVLAAGVETPGAWTHTPDDALSDHIGYTVAVKPATPPTGYTGPVPIAWNGVSAYAAGTTGVTITHGFTLADNDVLYAWVAWGQATGTWASSSGGAWTVVGSRSQAAGNDKYVAVLRRVVTSAAGEPATYTFTNGDAASQNIGVVLAHFRGANTTTPEDATATTNDGLDDFTPANPAITPGNAHNLVIIGAVIAGASPGSGDDYTGKTGGAPSGWTMGRSEIADDDDGVRHLLIVVATLPQETAATATPGTWTNSPDDATSDWAAVTIAVRDA